MDCIFCKIIKGEIPSYTIYEDEIVKVFMDVNPITEGHLLVIPKEHYLDVNEIPEDVLIHINKVTKVMFKLLKGKLNIDGLTLTQNNGWGQKVKHYHLHLIPRYINDNIDFVPLKTENNLEETYKKISE